MIFWRNLAKDSILEYAHFEGKVLTAVGRSHYLPLILEYYFEGKKC
jgi:hypothetical protein